MSNHLPDDNSNTNIRNYMLDPLTVIIKLAILASKPVGTKVCIYNNVMSFQEPGPFQSICRIIYSLNKTDLHFMYNPIQLACVHFLSPSATKSRPRMRNLFIYAQRGLEKLMETYRENSTIRHSLNYYHAIIANYVDAKYNTSLFRKDGMTVLYGDELVASLHGQWTEKWVKAVLDMNGFLSDYSISPENTRILESLMMTIDAQTKSLFISGGLVGSSSVSSNTSDIKQTSEDYEN
jgi:hypothetical protein